DLTKVKKKFTKKKDQIKKACLLLLLFDPCRIIFGKNKITSLALKQGAKDTHHRTLQDLAVHLKGQCALLLTDLEVPDLRKQFDAFRSSEFARPGVLASQSVTIVAGPLQKFSHTMEPYLRQLGLEVKLVRGVIHLEKDHKVCERDEVLTPEQCRILKHFDVQMSEFRVAIIASWSEKEGLSEIEDSDSYQMVTSLAPTIRVKCKKLDDDQYYFVSEPVDISEEG
ncbi:unnamed protein product, partial [Dicrocoelium dendriticum]